MKYCITGANGNISSLLTRYLLEAGHKVKVVGRNEQHLEQLKNAGAELAIGSVLDQRFLDKGFEGVDAVYTMCPPVANNRDGLVSYCEQVGEDYKRAIERNAINYVVNLSSVGAHLSEGSGHILGTNRVENKLNKLTGTHVLHLRPVFFYNNFFAQIDLIRNLAIMGSNFSFPTSRFPMVDPSDIARVAFEQLTALTFKGHTYRYIASDERTTNEVAALIGKAIDTPELKWVQFPDEQLFQGLIQSGFSDQTASEFVEGFAAMHEGKITEDYWKHRPQPGKVKLEDFAKKFTRVYSPENETAVPNKSSL